MVHRFGGNEVFAKPGQVRMKGRALKYGKTNVVTLHYVLP